MITARLALVLVLKSRPQALLVLTRSFLLNRDRIAASGLRDPLPLASIFEGAPCAGYAAALAASWRLRPA
jgi:hypothetical protein